MEEAAFFVFRLAAHVDAERAVEPLVGVRDDHAEECVAAAQVARRASMSASGHGARWRSSTESAMQRLIGVQARVVRCAECSVFSWQMGSMTSSAMTNIVFVNARNALERVHAAATMAAPRQVGGFAGDHAGHRAAPWRLRVPRSPLPSARAAARAGEKFGRHACLVHEQLEPLHLVVAACRCGCRSTAAVK